MFLSRLAGLPPRPPFPIVGAGEHSLSLSVDEPRAATRIDRLRAGHAVDRLDADCSNCVDADPSFVCELDHANGRRCRVGSTRGRWRRDTRGGDAVIAARLEPLRTLHLWAPGYAANRVRQIPAGTRRPSRGSGSLLRIISSRGGAARASASRWNGYSGGRPAGRASRDAMPTVRAGRPVTRSSTRKSNTIRPRSMRLRVWRAWVSRTSKSICITTLTVKGHFSIALAHSSSASKQTRASAPR